MSDGMGREPAYLSSHATNRYFIPNWGIILQKFRKWFKKRAEGPKAPSPGHRPGLLRTQTCRPVRAKALKIQAIYKAFALTGRLADCYYTQGGALG